MKQAQAVVNTTNRTESSLSFPSQAFSNVDCDQQINSSLIGLYTEVIRAEIEIPHDNRLSTTRFVSVLNNQAGPYWFPNDMIRLRYMEWIDPGIGQANARPEQWTPMLEIDDPLSRQMTQNYRGPTWKFANNGTAFVLNEFPTQDNPNGIRVEYVAYTLSPPAELVNPTDYITAANFDPVTPIVQSQFLSLNRQTLVRALQQAVIYDAAYVLGTSRRLSVAQELKEPRQEWHQRLIAVVQNLQQGTYQPPSTPLVSSRMPANTYSGRRGGWRR